MTDTTSINSEKISASNGCRNERRGSGGLIIPFLLLALFDVFLLIHAATTAPTAAIPAAIIVAAGWSIAIAIIRYR